jgi:hypothetical protein
MIKLIKPYKDFELDKPYDFGCVQNLKLVDKGLAVWIKVFNGKLQTK